LAQVPGDEDLGEGIDAERDQATREQQARAADLPLGHLVRGAPARRLVGEGDLPRIPLGRHLEPLASAIATTALTRVATPPRGPLTSTTVARGNRAASWRYRCRCCSICSTGCSALRATRSDAGASRTTVASGAGRRWPRTTRLTRALPREPSARRASNGWRSNRTRCPRRAWTQPRDHPPHIAGSRRIAVP